MSSFTSVTQSSPQSSTLLFADKSPYVLDTSLVSNNKPYMAFFQKGGKKGKKGTKLDITKQFMFLLLKITATDLKTPRNTSLNKCFTELKPFISEDFKYNKIKGFKGLELLCRHIRDLKEAFPDMNLSVTHFRDTDKHSVVIILMVLGIMKGSWLNQTATGKYERLGIVFHMLSSKDKQKIKEITFKSEYIPEECYKKIRALDLLHTAFAINKSVEESKENKNKVVKQTETMDVPLLLVQTNNEQNDDFEKEIADAEIIFYSKNKNKNKNKNINNILEENENYNRNNNSENRNKNENRNENRNENENENEEVEKEEVEVEGENEGPNANNIIRGALAQELENNNNEEFEENNEDPEEEEDEEVENESEIFNANPSEIRRIMEGNSNQFHQIIGENISNQSGGDGYYTAVGQIPIAGRPVIQGYASCCKPYFPTSGNEFDYMCQQGGVRGGIGLNNDGNHITLKSKTLLMVKQGVIYSITASVIDSIGENTANVMGMSGKHKNNIKEHMKKHMHNHTYNVVKEMVNNGTTALSGVIPSNDREIEFVPIRMSNGEQRGGNFIGTLGTLMFPGGNSIDNIVPWLLTLGSVLFKRIEKDIYKISSTLGKKKIKRKKSTKKSTKKVTRKSTKKLTRKKPTKKVTRKKLTKKVTRKNINIKTKRKWEPLTNANVRRLMKKSQGGGNCGSGICGDSSLRFFEGCKRPEWGVGSTKPMCI